MILDDYLDIIIEEPDNKYALTQVCIWIIEDFNKKGHKPTEYEIYEKLQLLLIDKHCEELTRKGMLDVFIGEQGEVYYKTTEKGLDALKNEKNP